MPTNLPAEAKAKWIKAMQISNPYERIIALQDFLSSVPKHKGTEKLISHVKHQIATLRREIEERERQRKSIISKSEYSIKKEGAAQVVLIGMTKSGKSSLLKILTKAKVEISDYPFATKKPAVGMLPYEDISFQLVEVPPIIDEGEIIGGAQALSLIRNSDGILMVLNGEDDIFKQFEIIKKTLERAGILIHKPNGYVQIEKRRAGVGIQVIGKVLNATFEDIKKLLLSYKISSAVVRCFGEVTIDDVENAIFENTIYKPSIIIINKIDNAKVFIEDIKKVITDIPIIYTSCKNLTGIDSIGETIFKTLEIIRVYTKKPLEKEPFKKPFIGRKGITILDLAKSIHSEFYKKFLYARIWGPSAKYPGEKVGLSHILEDGDIVEIHTR
jgi:ribosome-interacting GTPase 1